MPDQPGAQAQFKHFDDRQLEQFACPVCLGSLRMLPTGAQIACSDCRRMYPVIDGIPILIPDRATAASAPHIERPDYHGGEAHRGK
jgi:uncharacterized protein YbaR (Trm112 family)